MREFEYKKKQPVTTTDTGTAGQAAQAATTPATDEWSDTEQEAGSAYKQATATDAKTATTPAVTTNATDAVDADADAKKTILDGFLKQQEALNKEKEQIESQNPNTPEAIKKRNRRALIASIADGLSALSGMYFATKGAPATNNVVPGITEGIAKQNTADRNTYLELLQNWRKQNNELINNYATYQAAAERNRTANDNLQLSREREARLLAKDEAERAWKTRWFEIKQQGLDDAKAAKEADIAYKNAWLKVMNDHYERADAIAQQRASNTATDKNKSKRYKYQNGKLVEVEEETSYGSK